MRRTPAPIWRQTSTLAILQGRTHVYQFDRSQDRLSLHRACTLRINHDTLVERENSMARMKVLLLEDVPSLGLAGEVYAVAGGYARNYLIPRGYAAVATKGALKQAEEIKQAGIRRRAKERANAEAQAQVISSKKLLFHANAGDNDRLYGSVTAADIAERLEEACGFEIDRRRLQLGAALRDLGIFPIEIRLMPEVATTFEVAVVREGETWDDARARRQAREEAFAAAEAEAEAAAAAVAAAEAEEAAAEEAGAEED